MYVHHVNDKLFLSEHRRIRVQEKGMDNLCVQGNIRYNLSE